MGYAETDVSLEPITAEVHIHHAYPICSAGPMQDRGVAMLGPIYFWVEYDSDWELDSWRNDVGYPAGTEIEGHVLGFDAYVCRWYVFLGLNREEGPSKDTASKYLYIAVPYDVEEEIVYWWYAEGITAKAILTCERSHERNYEAGFVSPLHSAQTTASDRAVTRKGHAVSAELIEFSGEGSEAEFWVQDGPEPNPWTGVWGSNYPFEWEWNSVNCTYMDWLQEFAYPRFGTSGPLTLPIEWWRFYYALDGKPVNLQLIENQPWRSSYPVTILRQDGNDSGELIGQQLAIPDPNPETQTHIGGAAWSSSMIKFDHVNVCRPNEEDPDWDPFALQDEFADLLIWCNIRKVEQDVGITWPNKEDTELGDEGESGPFDLGQEVPVRLDELRALPYTHYEVWVHTVGGWTRITPAPFWTPPLHFRIDRKSARDHKIWIGQDIRDEQGNLMNVCDDCEIPINVPTLNKPYCDDDPFESVTIRHERVNLDLTSKGDDPTRVTSWEGSGGLVPDGGNAGSKLPFTFTIEAEAEEPILYREFATNWFDKVALIQEQLCIAELPFIYLQMRHNLDFKAECGLHPPEWPDEDVFCWLGAAYLGFRIDPPDDELRKITVRITYRELLSIQDNHYTGTTRIDGWALIEGEWVYVDEEFEVTVSPQKVVSFDVYFSKGYSNPRVLPICIRKTGNSPEVYMWFVDKIEFIFPSPEEEEIWTFHSLHLIHDPGDKNLSGDTVLRVEPSFHAKAKFCEDWRYGTFDDDTKAKCGGVSGHIDGAFMHVLDTPETYGQWEVERVIPAINFLVSSYLTLPLSRPWYFREYLELLTNVNDCWRWYVTDEDWENWIRGMSPGYSFWLFPSFPRQIGGRDDAEGAVEGYYPFAIRCGRWYPAGAQAYSPWASLIVGGSAHGQLIIDGAFERSKEDKMLVLSRNTEEDPWQDVATKDTDEHAHFCAGWHNEPYDYEYNETENYYTPKFRMWRVTVDGATDKTFDIARLYRRQLVPLIVGFGGIGCDAVSLYLQEDTGQLIYAYTTDTEVCVKLFPSIRAFVSNEDAVDIGTLTGASCPRILALSDGIPRIFFSKESSIYVVPLSVSTEGQWELGAMSCIMADRSCPFIAWETSLNLLAFACYNKETSKIEYASLLLTDLDTISIPSTSPVAEAKEVTPMVSILPDSSLILTLVSPEGKIQMYRSLDLGRSWTLQHEEGGT